MDLVLLSRVQVGFLSVIAIGGGAFAFWRARKISHKQLKFWSKLPAALLIGTGLVALYMVVAHSTQFFV